MKIFDPLDYYEENWEIERFCWKKKRSFKRLFAPSENGIFEGLSVVVAPVI